MPFKLKDTQSLNRRETQMILNHKAAIEFLVEQAEDVCFNVFTLMMSDG